MNIRRTIIICFFMSLRFNAYVLAAAEEPDLVQAAKREGRVAWYTVAGESQQLAQEFERRYPFVKVEVVRSTVYPLLTRILNEARTGNYLFDVVRQSTSEFSSRGDWYNPTNLPNARVTTPDGRTTRDIGPPPTITTLSSDTTQNWFRKRKRPK